MALTEYRIKLTKRAENDIDAIYFYIANKLQNPDAVLNHRDEFYKAAKSLRLVPKRNMRLVINKEQTKHRRQRVKNYYLYYIVFDNENIVEITTVQYCRRHVKNLDLDLD